jgi:hypothetical protein
MKRAGMIVGAVVVAVALGHGAVSADWTTRAARRTVGNLAQAGIENAVKDTAMDVTLDAAGVPDRPRLDRDRSGGARARLDDAGDDRDRSGIGSAAGDGLQAAMSVAQVGSAIDNTMELADAAKRANRVRKVVR